MPRDHSLILSDIPTAEALDRLRADLQRTYESEPAHSMMLHRIGSAASDQLIASMSGLSRRDTAATAPIDAGSEAERQLP